MKLSLTQMPELKEAIIELSQKEKDKLLIRLINKDQMLIKQMHYKLLENDDDLRTRTAELNDRIIESFKILEKQIARANDIKKYDVMNVHIRQLSGMVNEHASITKDKVSELELRLEIIYQCFYNFSTLYFLDYPNKSADKHFDYITARINSILAIYDKLHPDLQFDNKEKLLFILESASNTSISKVFKEKCMDFSTYYE